MAWYDTVRVNIKASTAYELLYGRKKHINPESFKKDCHKILKTLREDKFIKNGKVSEDGYKFCKKTLSDKLKEGKNDNLKIIKESVESFTNSPIYKMLEKSPFEEFIKKVLENNIIKKLNDTVSMTLKFESPLSGKIDELTRITDESIDNIRKIKWGLNKQ